MKNLIAIIVIAASFVSGVCRAELKPGATELNSVEKRLDLLIKQNQSLIAENSALKERCDKPKTKEEVFA
ncbi:MAG TPA: hypothetical protein PKD17_09535, partial [Cellvibrionaceae bacterium]|nr:hypothetical protein [Cellvibrionaceae bacterium]